MKVATAALLFIVDLVQRVRSGFDFNKIQYSQILRGGDGAQPCQHLTAANSFSVWTMFATTPISFMPTPGWPSYYGGRYIEDEVDPTRLGNPNATFYNRTQTSPIPILFIFQYHNASHCQLYKVLRNYESSGAAVNASTNPNLPIYFIWSVYNYNNNPNENFTACNTNSSALCFNISNFMISPKFYNFNQECVITLLANNFTDSDLYEADFYRIALNGAYVHLDNNWITPESNNYQGYAGSWYVKLQNYTGQWLNFNDVWANRFTQDTHAYGFSIPPSTTFEFDIKAFSPNFFPSVHLYIYNLSQWLQSHNNVGITLSVQIDSPHDPLISPKTVALFQAHLYMIGGNIFMDLTLTCSLSPGSVLSSTSQYFLNFGPALTTALQTTFTDSTTGAVSDGFTVAMSVSTRFISRRRWAGDFFDGEAIGLITIYEGEVDTTNATTATPNRITAALNVQYSANDNRVIDGTWTGGQFWYTGDVGFPTPSPVDVRLRAAEYQTGLFDYSYFVSNFYYNVNFSSYHYCRNPIAPSLVAVGDSTKCARWSYQTSSGFGGCSRSWSYAMCDYCNPGYGSDPINPMKDPIVCRTKAQCDATLFYNWKDNGFLAINNNTDKALCLSCPANCEICDGLVCSQCSNYSTWNNGTQQCDCNVVNCTFCSYTACDQCLQYDTNNKLGNILYRNTNSSAAPNNRTCNYTVNYNCSLNYGMDNTYIFNNFVMVLFPTCTSCLLPNCLNCSWNNTMCWKCQPGYSLLNLSLALGTDFMVKINCTNEHLPFQGLYEDNMTLVPYSYYKKCPQPNCQVCQGNLTSCTTCMPGFHWSPDMNLCYNDSICNNSVSWHYLTSNTPVQCELCIANCIYCNDSSTCFYCTGGYLAYQSILGNANASQCIPIANCSAATNTFVGIYGPRPNNNSYLTCLDCIPHCQNCSDNTTCILCLPGYYYHAGLKMCLTQIDCQNMTIQAYVNFNNKPPDCLSCLRNCTQCQNNTFCDVCNTSFPLYHLDDNLCVDSTYCSPLQSSYQVGTSRYCKHCKVGCQNCSTDLDCWQCQNGKVLDADNVTCLATCNSQTCSMNTTHCTACPSKCNTCHYNQTDPFGPAVCDTCFTGYYFNLSNSCVQCTASLQVLINNTCHWCKVPNCTSCKGGEMTCVDCIDQYYVDSNAACQLCVPPLIYTTNKSCLACAAPNCDVCNTDDVNRCVKCNKGYYFQGLLCVPHFFVAISAEFSADKLQMTVTFQHKITGLPASNLRMYSVVPGSTTSAEKHNMTIQQVVNSPTDPKTYFIKVSNLSNDSSIQVYLEFNDTLAVSSADKKTYTLDPNNKTIATATINRYVQDSFFGNLNANSVATGTTIVILIGSLISFNYAVVMMQIYQMMQFMLLYNVDYPYNFKKFILLFSAANPLNSLPDIFKHMYDNNCADLGANFVVQSIGCQFLGNVSPDLFLLVCYLGLRLINTVLYHSIKKKSGGVVRFVTRLHHGFLGPMGLHFWLTMFDMDILVASFTNSKYYGGDKNTTIQAIGNHLLSQTINYFYPVYLFYYFYKARQIHLNRFGQIDLTEDDIQRYEFLVEDFKESTWYQKYAEIFALSKNYFICMFVVGFYDVPTAQLTFTTLILATTLYLEVKHRPYKLKLPQIVSIIVWSIYLGLSFCFTLLNFVNGHMSMPDIFTYIGNPMIFLFAGLIGINFIPILIALGVAVWKAYKKCKDRKKNQIFSAVSGKDQAHKSKEDHSAINKVQDLSMEASDIKLDPLSSEAKPHLAGKIKLSPNRRINPQIKPLNDRDKRSSQPRRVLRDR